MRGNIENNKDAPIQPMYDIDAENGRVEIQVSYEKDRIWIHVDGHTILRICRIKEIIRNDDNTLDMEQVAKLTGLRTRLKTGNYDGNDIMNAWLLIDKILENNNDD